MLEMRGRNSNVSYGILGEPSTRRGRVCAPTPEDHKASCGSHPGRRGRSDVSRAPSRTIEAKANAHVLARY